MTAHIARAPEKVRIVIRDQHGHPMSDVIDAEIVGPFAIHESRNYKDCYTLTHVNTGLSIVNDADSEDDCRAGASLLQGLPINWSALTFEEAQSIDEELMRRINSIRRVISVQERPWSEP